MSSTAPSNLTPNWHQLRYDTVVVNNLSIALSLPEPTQNRKKTQQSDHGDFGEAVEIEDISFVTSAGEAIGLVGTGGSGCNTLAKAIAGQLEATKGQVFVVSEPVMLGKIPTLMPFLSAERNLMLAGLARGLSRKQVKRAINEVASFTELHGYLHETFEAYPQSMKYRLYLAIALLKPPDILISDKAIIVGDDKFRAKTVQCFEELRARGSTLFYICRGNKEVRELCNRVLWMDKGKLIKDGDTETVLTAFTAYEEISATQNVDPNLFTNQDQPPNPPPIVSLTPENPTREDCVKITWSMGRSVNVVQRNAEVSIRSPKKTWEFRVAGAEQTFLLDPHKYMGLFAQRDPFEVRVRTWGIATTGGDDGAGASQWSNPIPLVFEEIK